MYERLIARSTPSRSLAAHPRTQSTWHEESHGHWSHRVRDG